MAQISSDVEEYVQRKLASREFSSRQELMEEAIRVYCELEQRYTDFRTTVKQRIQEADRGELGPLDIDAIKAELRQEFDQPQSTR